MTMACCHKDIQQHEDNIDMTMAWCHKDNTDMTMAWSRPSAPQEETFNFGTKHNSTTPKVRSTSVTLEI